MLLKTVLFQSISLFQLALVVCLVCYYFGWFPVLQVQKEILKNVAFVHLSLFWFCFIAYGYFTHFESDEFSEKIA